MATIGEQIITARKAKGLTQDVLAKALNVSRATISNYECNRRLPDAQTLLKLSALLEYSFEEETGKALPREVKPEAGTPDPPAEAGAGEPREAAHNRRKPRVVLLWAAAVLAVCMAVGVSFALNRAKKPAGYRADDGTLYTIEQFQQETPREDGKAWLLGETNVKTIAAEGNKVWMYDFIFHEMNGVGLKIDRLEVCTFSRDGVMPVIISGDQLSLYGLEDRILPLGDWKETGGLPVSDRVRGAGITLHCTDDSGEAKAFSNFVTLSADT